jgi:hypothetical protein
MMDERKWRTVQVRGLDELIAALERAERKGYMPDAISDQWAQFDYRAAPPPPAAPVVTDVGLKVDKIMEQAQVFASAWSLVGSPFDDGDCMDCATEQKLELRNMVLAALEAKNG